MVDPNNQASSVASNSQEIYTIDKNGIHNSLHGHIYQMLLFLLILVKIRKDNEQNQVGMEIGEGEKFGDVVCKTKDGSYRLLQAKHKQNGETILEPKNFFNKTIFNLKKHFEAFRVINGNIKDVILATNAKFEISDKDSISNLVECVHKVKKLYFERIRSQDPIFGGHKYRFKLKTSDPKKNDITRDTLVKTFQTNEGIDDFMNKFLLVTNYTMEDINKELFAIFKKEYNLWDISVIYNKFIAEITNYVIGLKPYDNVKLCNEYNLNKILENTKSVLLSAQTVGRNLHIKSESAIEFKNLQDITMIDRILFMRTEVGETQFVRSKFFQANKKNPLDTYILLQSSFSEDDLDKGLELFKSSKTYNLCMFEICSKESCTAIVSRLTAIAKNYPSKKLIVAYEGNIITNFKDGKKIKQKAIKLSYVTDECFDRIINDKKITLQGVTIDANKIINKNSKDILGLSLTKLLNFSKIGGPICDPTENLYIDRVLVHDIQLNPEVKEDPLLKEKITFDATEFESRCRDNEKEFEKAKSGAELHFLFEKLDKDGKVEELWWRKYKGSIKKLRKYFKSAVPEHLENVDEYSDRITLIVDKAGNGKTTYFNHMAKKLKEEFEDHFVINVCLNDHTDYLEENTFDSIVSVAEFFAEVLKLKEGEMEKSLLRNSILNSGKCIVLLDGADEIAPDCEKKFSKIVQFILETNFSKIYILIRPELREKLEEYTKQFHKILLPFTKQDQIDCMTRFWNIEFEKRKVEGSNSDLRQTLDEEGMKKFAQDIIDYVNRSINDSEMKLTGVPLMTRMLAEIHEDQVLKRSVSQDDAANRSILNAHKIKNIYQLYELFFYKKIRIYCIEKEKSIPSNKHFRRNFEEKKSKILMLCLRFAIYSTNIFSAEQLKLIPDADKKRLIEKELKYISDSGFFSGPFDGLKFIHRTFAEYLIAQYLVAKCLTEKLHYGLLNDILSDKDKFTVIERFINSSPKFKDFREKLIAKGMENLTLQNSLEH